MGDRAEERMISERERKRKILPSSTISIEKPASLVTKWWVSKIKRTQPGNNWS